MQPIIPIWLIYLSGVVDNLKSTVGVIGMSTIAFCVIGILCIIMSEMEWTRLCTKFVKFGIIGVFIMFVSSLIPSQKTIYTMMIGSQLTTKNIELVGGTVKSTMDYMFDKTEGLIKSAKDSK